MWGNCPTGKSNFIKATTPLQSMIAIFGVVTLKRYDIIPKQNQEVEWYQPWCDKLTPKTSTLFLFLCYVYYVASNLCLLIHLCM